VVRVEVLKVAHHGSAYSTGGDFLRVVQPELAVYSAGVGNRYGHPADTTLDRLHSIGAVVLGTDEHGSIRVSTDGTHWSVTDAGGSVLAATTVTAPPSEGNLFLNIEPVTVTGQGNDATLRASTLAGASCSITVYYKSGPSTAAGLFPKVADADGRASWTWRVGTRTTPGTYRIEVSATLGDTTTSESVWFQVLDTGNPG